MVNVWSPVFLLAALTLIQPAAALRFDSARAWEHLRQLVAIGPRPSGSAAIEQTRAYIKRQLQTVGVGVADQAWDAETPIDRVHMVNLIATFVGAVDHYDVLGNGVCPFRLRSRRYPTGDQWRKSKTKRH